MENGNSTKKKWKALLIFTIILAALIYATVEVGDLVYDIGKEVVRFTNSSIRLHSTTIGDLFDKGFTAIDGEAEVRQIVMRDHTYTAPELRPHNQIHTVDGGIPFEKDGVIFNAYIENSSSSNSTVERCVVFRVIVYLRDNPGPFELYGKTFVPEMDKTAVSNLLFDYQVSENSASNRIRYEKKDHTITARFDDDDEILVSLSVGLVDPNDRDTSGSSFADYLLYIWLIILFFATACVIRSWYGLLKKLISN